MTTAPIVGVLALQGDVREHVFALGEAGARALPVRRPDELAGIDGLILPGGESTTMIKLATVFDLLEPLRKAISVGLPAYGVCAGMILLADRLLDAPPGQETLGGIDMAVRRNAFGRQVDSFEEDLQIPVLGEEPVRAVFIRAPWVESVGDGVDVLATAQGTGHAGRIVAVRQEHLLATSFHPELTGDARLHKLFVGMVRERS
ncbi:MAG: pyridoxal 5'-phosphate synthase glutaminase subunit PdxT [Actinomycetota bacterium]|nr:pyridoxal 5'-phosphate synthase glutaminase subunit PdxT [Actinomycetota bacterium]